MQQVDWSHKVMQGYWSEERAEANKARTEPETKGKKYIRMTRFAPALSTSESNMNRQ